MRNRHDGTLTSAAELQALVSELEKRFFVGSSNPS